MIKSAFKKQVESRFILVVSELYPFDAVDWAEEGR
jgi:hypothetical protein